MYQNYVCVGRLTRDVDLRYTPNGTPVADLGIAINEKRKVGDEYKEETLFLDVTVWNKQAELCSEYLSKGRLILVDGKLRTDKWQDKDGNIRSKVYLVANNVKFVDSKGVTKVESSSSSEYSGPVNDKTPTIDDNDLPF